MNAINFELAKTLGRKLAEEINAYAESLEIEGGDDDAKMYYTALTYPDYYVYPTRSAGHPARNPSPAEVRAAREAAGLTQAQAAALVHTNLRAWQRWEADEATTETARRMHPGLWELFRIKAGVML